MSKIAISGASGDLGRRTTQALLQHVEPRSLTLVTRDPDSLAAAAAQGAKVCRGNYRDPASLEAAYAGNDVLMVISGHAVSKRIPEHRNAIAAAKKAGIKHIVYTSVAGVHPRNPTISAGDHIVTEQDLRESGLGYTILRNQTYAELFPLMAQSALDSGKWFQVGNQGVIAPVSKRDIAACAATCLLEPGRHSRVTYEITGPELLSFPDIARMFSALYDVPIEYVVVTPEEMYAKFDSWGIPRGYTEGATDPAVTYGSEELVTAYVAFDQDYHAILSHHVQFITGKKPYPLREIVIAAGLARQGTV
jgi:NAD(P)H dehydrogenase (quinone)